MSTTKTSFKSDMADELHGNIKESINGVDISKYRNGKLSMTRLEISTLEAAKKIGKECGIYYMIDTEPVSSMENEDFFELARHISACITELLPYRFGKSAMIVGLGNRKLTPDSIGPLTLDKLIVTKHIKADEELSKDFEQFADVCAFEPNVMGVTGIESSDMITAVAEKIKPDFLIVIDSLASSNGKRIGASIQISDAGIEPGSGIGNRRYSISEKSTGIPVIAIGIPTVVYAETLAYEFMRKIMRKSISEDEIEMLISKLMAENDDKKMVVTPKEIDGITKRSAELLAFSLNLALHNKLSEKEILNYMM